MSRSALLLGATGLIGGHCLELLLRDEGYGRVVTLGRRPLDRTHARLTHHVIDFDREEAYRSLPEAQDVFCCLGTTMKQAGSKEAFRKVDLHYPVAVAQAARAQGAEQYVLVSSLGASPTSRIFYSRTKGEAEAAVRAIPLEGVYLFRPSLLTGERAEMRTGEQVSERVLNALSFLLVGPLHRYRPIAARTVAAAMVAVAKRRPGGIQVYEPDAIRALAG